MSRPTDFAILGAHERRPGWFDAIDLALRLGDGAEVAFGLRTADYLSRADGATEQWDGYVPFAVTIDLQTVRHWDFNKVLWLGPDPWPCLVWSNAIEFSEKAIHTTFGPSSEGRLIKGPEGRGLPPLGALGHAGRNDLAWRAFDA